MQPQHTWQFFRAGGVDQVIIRNGADIAHLPELDQKLWVALACPTRGIEFDPRTLDLIDLDKDGRIRPPELLAACAWAVERLNDPDELANPADGLRLSAIRSTGEDGPALVAEARRILGLAGTPDADTIPLATVVERAEQLQAMRFNGDGVVTAETAEDDTVAHNAIALIAQTHGTVPAVGEQPAGINRELATAFFDEVDQLRDWAAKARGASAGLALGEGTLDATQAMNAVRHKIDDYFARTRLAAYDAKAAEDRKSVV